MEDLLQYIPILTVCVVGILLVIVLGVTVAPRSGRQAWNQHDEETGPTQSIQSHSCCFICCCKRRSNQNKVQPINDDIITKHEEQLTQPRNLQPKDNEQKQEPSTQQVNSARSEATNSTVPSPCRNSKESLGQKIDKTRNRSSTSQSSDQRADSDITSEPSEQEKEYEKEIAEKLLANFFRSNKKWLQNKVLCSLTEYSTIKKFIDQSPQTAEKIWISNSLNCTQADQLKDKFKQCTHRPVIYIGRVCNYTSRDRQGLKELVKAGFTLRVWENVSSKIKPRYDSHLDEYIKSIVKEAEECPDRERHDYTEEQVTPIALGEIGITHLLTNSGRLYRSKCEKKKITHAEIVFINQQEQQHEGDDISQIWIKNSPCSECSNALKEFLKNQGDLEFLKNQGEISIYIGSIYERRNEPDGDIREYALLQDKKGMVELLRTHRNVMLELWATYNDTKYGEQDDRTIRHIQDVMRRAGRT